jgi:hypothetical protein
MSNPGTLTVTIDTSALVSASDLDAALAGKLDNTGDGSNVTAAFTAAGTRENITTGEKLSVLFGKIAKFFTDLKTVAFTGSYNDLDNKPTIPAAPTDATIVTTDVTTNNASTSKHGWAPKATAPSSGHRNILAIDNGESVYKNAALFDTTVPSTQAFGDSASVGTAMTAARRDHKHAMPASTKDKTSVTGMLKGNGTAISAAVRGTDYSLGFSGTGTVPVGTSWSGPDAEGYYYYTLTASGVTADDEVDVTWSFNPTDADANALVLESFSAIFSNGGAVTVAGGIKFYCTEQIVTAVPVVWKLVR